jgi:hypothetical protein
VLENLGWREPEHKGQNWFRTFRPLEATDYQAIVGLLRRAFVEVYRLPPEARLVMKTSWEGQTIAPTTQISFASEGHRSTFEKVAKYAVELYGNSVSVDPRKPLIFIQQGSAVITLSVNPIGIHSSLVELYCLLVREIETSPDLLRWLLQENYRIRFGALSLNSEGNVVLKHALVGDTLSEKEIKIVLKLLVDLADELDNRITKQFGGLTARGWTHR